MLEPKICQLFIYPIKSCAGISVSEMSFDEKGPLLDRRWMLVDEKTHSFLSQREIRQMCLVLTSIIEGEVWASQSMNSAINARFKLPSINNKSIDNTALVDVVVWEDSVQGYDCGDDAADWFSALLNHKCRLIFQGECGRNANEQYADKNTEISFADGFPLLVINKESVDFLDENCVNSSLSVLNFRANIVVENLDKFSENDWGKISTDTLEMKVVKPCERCVIPTLNPKTSLQDKNILNVLLKHCRRDKKLYFGQNLTFKKFTAEANLRIGDCVLIEKKPE